jgi:hypothetical protein
MLTLVLFFLAVSIFSLSDTFKMQLSLKRNIYFLLSLAIAIFSLLRCTGDTGHDITNYRNFYSSLSTFNDFINGTNRGTYSFEIGYGFINAFIKMFIENGTYGIALIVLFNILGVTFGIYRYTQYCFIALLVYIGRFYGWNGIILIRQTCALAILFPLIKIIPEKKYFRGTLIILLASLFHISSLFYFLAFPMYKIFRNNKILMIAVVISFFMGFFDIIPQLIIAISGFIPRGRILVAYVLSSGKGANMLGYVEMLFVLCAAVYFKARLCRNNKYIELAIVYLGFAVMFGGMFQRFEISTRVTTLFSFYAYIIILPSFINIFKKYLIERLTYVSILSTYLLVFFIRFFYVLGKY